MYFRGREDNSNTLAACPSSPKKAPNPKTLRLEPILLKARQIDQTLTEDFQSCTMILHVNS